MPQTVTPRALMPFLRCIDAELLEKNTTKAKFKKVMMLGLATPISKPGC